MSYFGIYEKHTSNGLTNFSPMMHRVDIACGFDQHMSMLKKALEATTSIESV